MPMSLKSYEFHYNPVDSAQIMLIPLKSLRPHEDFWDSMKLIVILCKSCRFNNTSNGLNQNLIDSIIILQILCKSYGFHNNLVTSFPFNYWWFQRKNSFKLNELFGITMNYYALLISLIIIMNYYEFVWML